MRTLSTTLKNGQQAQSLEPIAFMSFTPLVPDGYYLCAQSRVVEIVHEEDGNKHRVRIVLDNSDGDLDERDFRGYRCDLFWGVKTGAGEEFVMCAPTWVITQRFGSSPGVLDCVIETEGAFTLLAEDRAMVSYIPDETDTKTIKTLINQILGASLTCFSFCKAWEVVWDSEDSIIDSYTPKDSFRVYRNGSRLTALNELLSLTKCVMRPEADGKIHIFVPTTTGTTYDYEYSLDTGHTFFSKANRTRLVIPNWVNVKSEDDDDPQYAGSASDSDSFARLPKRQYYQMFLESNAQAQAIAEAMIAKAQLWSEAGSADVPMNVGAEVYDYIKVTDSRQGDTRVGNIGAITRYYRPKSRDGRDAWHMTFSFGKWTTTEDVLRRLGITSDDLQASFSRLSVKDLYVENILAENCDFVWLDPDNTIDLSLIGDDLDSLPDGEVYARVKSLHLDAGIIQLDENIVYKAGYDPTDKFDLGLNDLDDIPDGAVFQRVKSAALTAEGLVLLDQVVIGTYGLVAATDISAGHILLSKTVKDGEWYKTGGVKIDATYGVTVYGQEAAFRTRATEFGVDQVYISSDGSLKAGGGYVVINAAGISFYYGYLFFYDSTAVQRGYIRGENNYLYIATPYGTNIRLSPGAGVGSNKVYTEGDLFPLDHEEYECGVSYAAWLSGTFKYLWSDDGSVYEYQEHDDIAILKGLKVKKNKKGRDALDASSLPSELTVINERGDQYVSVPGLQGLSLGVMKALLKRIEALEAKVGD